MTTSRALIGCTALVLALAGCSAVAKTPVPGHTVRTDREPGHEFQVVLNDPAATRATCRNLGHDGKDGCVWAHRKAGDTTVYAMVFCPAGPEEGPCVAHEKHHARRWGSGHPWEHAPGSGAWSWSVDSFLKFPSGGW
jgi:hypothetical protein